VLLLTAGEGAHCAGEAGRKSSPLQLKSVQPLALHWLLLPHPDAMPAQEKFGKPFEELSTHEKQAVGGVHAGSIRGGDLAEPEKAPPPPEVCVGLCVGLCSQGLLC
jgi:hypothetical protein